MNLSYLRPVRMLKTFPLSLQPLLYPSVGLLSIRAVLNLAEGLYHQDSALDY